VARKPSENVAPLAGAAAGRASDTRAAGDLSPVGKPTEAAYQTSLRPGTFDDYVGQPDLIANLRVFVAAAKKRGEALDHVLFAGPPGLGKTTLAHVIANELGVNLHVTSGPAIDHKGVLASLLTSLGEGDVLFIDEIHRLNPVVEENLYPAMEDFRFDLFIGDGPHAKSVSMHLPRFTLLGATTRLGLLTSPLHSRFQVHNQLQFYSVDDLTKIVLRSAGILELPIDRPGAREIARRSRGTPRIANRLLRRVRDFADVEGDGSVTETLAAGALDRLQVDRAGLDVLDRAYLMTLVDRFDGGPTGIEALAASLSEDKGTLEEVVEPFLLQEGFIARTKGGRVAQPRAFSHLRVAPPAGKPRKGKKTDDQGELF